MSRISAAKAPAARPNHGEPADRRPSRRPTARGSRARPSRLRSLRGERREHHPEHLDQRVGRRRDRDPVLGRFPARELSAPGERVERVVVGEADAGRSATARRPRRRSPQGAGASKRSIRALTSGHAIRFEAVPLAPRAAARAWVDSSRGVDRPATGASRASPVPVSQAPAPHVRRRRRPGAGGAHAAQRRAAREGPPRLPVRRLARDGQDLDGEDPRGVPELRARPDDRAVRGVRIVPLDRARELARRDRDGRGVEQLGR